MQPMKVELDNYRRTARFVSLDNAVKSAEEAISNKVATAETAEALLELSTYVDSETRVRYRAYAEKVVADNGEVAEFDGARAWVDRLRKEDAALAGVAAKLPKNRGLPADEYLWRFRAANSRGNLSKEFAEEALAAPVPETPDALYLEFSQNGNRVHYEKPYFLREHYLDALVAVEYNERQGRYIAKIEEILTAMCEMKAWTLPAHDRALEAFHGNLSIVDLFASQYAAHMACAIQMVGDRLDPKLVHRIHELAERRIFSPLRRVTRYGVTQGADPRHREVGLGNHWWIDNAYNWNAVCWNNVVCAALYFLDDPRDRAFFVDAALKSVPTFLSGFSPDGYCHEGMGYWNYGFGYHLMMARLLKEMSGGRINIVSIPQERAIAAYGRGAAFDLKKAPSFADGGGAPSADVLRLVDYFWPENSKSFIPSTAFPDAQMWIFRDPDGLSVGFKGGDNGVPHNHNDLGSYDIRLRGETASGDPGGENYTARTFSDRRYESKVLNSYGHPVPVVGGKLQEVGSEYCSTVVAAKIDDEGTSEVVLELKKAYDVKSLESLTRTFRYDRKAKTFTVTDKVRFSEPTEFEDAYTVLPPANLKPEVQVTGADFTIKEELIDNSQRLCPLRCGIVLDKPVTEAEVRICFKP